MRRKISSLVAAVATAALVVACIPAQGGPRTTEAEPSRSSATPSAGLPPSGTPEPTAPTDPTDPTGPPDRPEQPNIVMVLMDDFSMDLLPTLGVVRQFERRGAVYEHFVVDSLCCVSRASLMTGQYPHQTGVLTNTGVGGLPGEGPMGGWQAFETYGNTARSVSVALQEAGYTTGFVGKYLNEFEYQRGIKPLPPMPPGWSQFNVVFGSAYDGWGFDSTEVVDGALRVRHHPTPPASASDEAKDAAYAGQVIEDYALDFIRARRADDQPYFLHVAPYAPHNRTNPEGAWRGEPLFPAAFRDRPGGTRRAGNCGPVPCRSLTVDDLPGYGAKRGPTTPRTGDGKRTRHWNTVRTLSERRATHYLRTRAQMLQSVDRTVRRILRAVDEDTYVVFTSDNGFHMGQLGMGLGKGTAYDTDVRAPLLVIGPDVAPGSGPR